jgi:four helix bundle protein
MTGEPIRTFEDLDCWKACRSLRLFVARELCPVLPKDERFRLADQVLRAARSATANIAEGYGRFHYLDNAKFCSNARGSCWEVVGHMITAKDEGLIAADFLERGRKIAEQAIALLNGYISYLRRASKQKGPESGPQ